jgi:membrane-bound ClpP family serine protease
MSDGNPNKNQFPRTNQPPTQSSKYWAKEKDRYIRQLLLSDLRELTQKETIVYFSQLNQGINHTDADDLSEVIEGLTTGHADIIIQTPGGAVDAVEKIITLLKCRLESYRVIVPSWAKSGGTAIAISSNEILLGVNSELGPIDPQMGVPEFGFVPCQFVANDDSQSPLTRQIARNSVERMQELAKKILHDGMLSDKDEQVVNTTVDKLSSSDSYKSHGAVIDYSEAKSLGLNVSWLAPESKEWKLIWLLYSCYDYDTKIKGMGKIIEGEKFSISRPTSNFQV